MKKYSLRQVLLYGIPAILGVTLVLAYPVISYRMAASITEAERKALESDPTFHGMEYEDVRFPPRGEDIMLDGWYMTGQHSGPVLIFVHGLNNNREENGDFLMIASDMLDRGYGSLLFDLRGHGTSEGERVSGGFYERQDVLGAFDYLVENGVSPDEIGVLGFSMGASTAVLSVAEDHEIRALAVDSAFADVSDLIAQETARRTVFPEWVVPIFVPGMSASAKLVFGIDIGEIVPEDAVQRLDYPVLIIHGANDTRIEAENSERIFEAAHEASELWLAPDAEHTDAYPMYPVEYIAKLEAYFDSRLKSE